MGRVGYGEVLLPEKWVEYDGEGGDLETTESVIWCKRV